jgi:hypothetical protein
MNIWMISRAITFGLLGAAIMLASVVLDDGTFETVSQLRAGPEDRSWLNPRSFLVRSHQEGARKALQRKCLGELKNVERAIFVQQICTTARSRTCVMGRPRWSGNEIIAPLVSEGFWDQTTIDDQFSVLGTEMLRFKLSDSAHGLNEALSKGAVEFDRQTVSFNSEALATSYFSKMAGVCGALDLKEPSRIILTNETD